MIFGTLFHLLHGVVGGSRDLQIGSFFTPKAEQNQGKSTMRHLFAT